MLVFKIFVVALGAIGFVLSDPTSMPSSAPSVYPTNVPTLTMEPTSIPTMRPSLFPTSSPVTESPSMAPVLNPTSNPTSTPPTGQPTTQPSTQPTGQPSVSPTSPTSVPTTRYPTVMFTPQPTVDFNPTSSPTIVPTSAPSGQPVAFPTAIPTQTFRPTSVPSCSPTVSSGAPTGIFQTHTVDGEVRFDNPDSGFCRPMSVNITLKFNQPIGTVGQWFIIKTPGLTTGPCLSTEDGGNITDVSVQDDTYFHVNYYEGSWKNYYKDSYIRLQLKEAPVVVGFPYQILMDRSNKFKRNCISHSWFTVQEYRTVKKYGTIGWLNITNFPDNVYRQCYAYSAKLSFFPRYQKFPTAIKLQLALAFQIYPGDTIKVFLPGFTNSGRYLSNTDRSIVSSATGTEVLSSISWTTNFNWTNYWYEGSLSSLYQDSYIMYTVQDEHYAYYSDNAVLPARDGSFNLTIDKASQISAYCGQHSNYSGFSYEIVSRVFNVTKTSFTEVDGIGPGCKGQNDCNGNGVCNYCTSTCECFNGFGSALDLTTAVTDNFHADCSSRACPLGPAVRNSGRDSLSVSTMHRMVECSNNGLCNRNNGTCDCFNGFGGAACEKMNCPGTPACSGRGICLPQQYLTVRSDALPLTNSTTTKYLHVPGDSGTSWDAKFGHACVCDSSWTVGLGANETQRAEYFGPGCEYRRCPSGDNPQTTVDETDCEGKSQIPGGANGTAGNLCHVDCSNQGICDYTTGVCACFPGYTNSNCGTRSVL